MKRLLVIGNGSTGVDGDAHLYVNNHTGHFLSNLNSKVHLTFGQHTSIFDKNNNLLNFDLKSHHVTFQGIAGKKNIKFLPSLFRLILKQDFIYIFYPGSLGKIVALLSFLLGKKYGFYIRGQYYNNGKVDRLLLKKSQFCLTVSPSIKEDLQRFSPKVDVIKPMISITKKDLNYKRDYSKPKVWDFLFVGRVEYRKGIYELIEIAKLFREAGLEFHLNIVGGGDLFIEIQELLIKNELSNHVTLHGLVSDKDQLKRLYHTSHAFIFTSHDEGFPRVLYESMASGLPIFTTFVGGIAGRMKNKVNCVKIPAKSPRKATEIILNYIQDDGFIKEIGQNSLTTMKEIIDGNLLSHDELLLKNIQDE